MDAKNVTMDDLKEMAEDILECTARGWYDILMSDMDATALDKDDFSKLVSLLEDATVSVSWE